MKKIRKLVMIVMICLITMSIYIPAFASETNTETVTDTPADPYSGIGCYMAFFQCQTTTWVYRNNFEDTGAGYGTDIFKSVYDNESKTPTSTIINDAVIDGDGEYTISLNSVDLKGSTDFNMVGISTNIPLDSGIEVKDAVLKYGNKTITSEYMQKIDSYDYVHIMLINQYDNTMKDTVSTLVPVDGSDMTITFKVSGFGYDKAPSEEDTADSSKEEDTKAEATNTPAPTDSASETSTTTDDTTSSKAISTSTIAGIIVGVVIILALIFVIGFNRKKKS